LNFIPPKNRFLSHDLGDLGVTYALHLQLVGRPTVHFLFVIAELFLLSLQLRGYKCKAIKAGIYRRGCVTLSADFRWNGTSPTNHCWCQNTRMIALSCGIKISAVHCLVLSRTMRVNYDSQDCTCIALSRCKKQIKYRLDAVRVALPGFLPYFISNK